MKTLLTFGITLILVLFCSAPSPIYAAPGTSRPAHAVQMSESERAMARFQVIVKTYKAFFAGNPIAVSKQEFSKSPTGYIYCLIRFTAPGVSYDVTKTDSLVSPYAAYIEVPVTQWSNAKKGPVTSSTAGYTFYYGFDSLDAAQKFKGATDFDYDTAFQDTHVRPVRFQFAYQEDRWVFKGVILKDGSKEDGMKDVLISSALGDQTTFELAVDENKRWRLLLP